MKKLMDVALTFIRYFYNKMWQIKGDKLLGTNENGNKSQIIKNGGSIWKIERK